MRAPMRSPVSSRCFTRARPDRRKLLYMPCRNTQTLRSPPAHRRQRRRRHTSPEQLPQNLRQPALRKELRMTQPYRNARKTRAILNRTRYPLGERPLASRPRTARSDTHDRDAPSLSTDAAQEGRIPDALPARPQKPLPTATPRSPGIPPEHGSSHGPGSQHGTASCPCGPPDRPASGPSCREGSVCERSRAGFFKPSLEGGLPLLPLFRPRRRSRSPIRSRSQAFSNSRRAIFCPEVSDPGTLNGSNGSERLIQRLTHFQTPASTPHQLRHPGQLRQNMTSPGCAKHETIKHCRNTC